jgi:hypothetical protein
VRPPVERDRSRRNCSGRSGRRADRGVRAGGHEKPEFPRVAVLARRLLSHVRETFFERTTMDLVMILLTALLLASGFGLILLCDRLREGDRP